MIVKDKEISKMTGILESLVEKIGKNWIWLAYNKRDLDKQINKEYQFI